MGFLTDWTCRDHVAEIVYLLFKISESLLEPSIRLYIYQSICADIYSTNSTEICFNLSGCPAKQSVIQSAAADYMIIYKILMNCPAIILGFFCGAWSDIIGRKVPVLLTLAATIFADVMCLLSMTGGAVPYLSLIMIGAAIRGGFGKSAVISMALYSYTCDETETENRTKRIGKLISMSYFGYFIGSLLSGALLQGYGFGLIFTVATMLNVSCVIIVVMFMKGKKDSEENNDQHYSKFPFRVANLQQSIQVLIKERHHRCRLHIILLFCVVFIQQICKAGELDAVLLFVESSPLNWPKYMYGYLLAVDYVLLGLSVLFLLPILINLLNLKDMQLVLTGVAFQVIRLIILAFSGSTLGVYFSSIVGCPSALVLSCSKALISKTVGPGERGKAFSLLSCAETVAHLIGVVIFDSIYKQTRDLLPGFIFAMEAIFFVLLFGALVLLGRDMKLAAQIKLLEETGAAQQQNGEKKDVNGMTLLGLDHPGMDRGYQSNHAEGLGFMSPADSYQKTSADSILLNDLKQQKEILEKFDVR